MRAQTTSFLRMWLQAAVELIIFFPPVLLLHHWFISIPIMVWIAVLIGFYSLGYLTCKWLRLDKWYNLLGAGLFCSFVVVYGGFGLSFSGIVTGLLGFYLFLRGTFMVKQDWKTVFPIQLYWMGLVLYFIVSVFFRLFPDMQGYLPALFWLGIVSVALTLLMAGQERIIQESMPEKNGRHLVNNTQLWHIRFLSIAMLLIIALAAAFKQLIDGLTWLNGWFWRIVLLIAAKLSELLSSKQTAQIPPAKQQPPPLQLPAGKPSAFLVWVEKLLYVLFVAVVIIAVLYLGFLLCKWLIRYYMLLYNWLKSRLEHSGVDQMAGFEDQSTRLTTWGELIKNYSTKASEWLDQLRKREVKWSDLKTNAERTRYLYRLFVMKGFSMGYPIDTYLTAREMILSIQQRMPELSHPSEKLTSLYNQARYSDHPIRDEDIEMLSKALKKD
jgi:hypothetical protein